MKSSLRSISRVLVFAFATTLVPVHVLAMEAVPVVPSQSDDRVLNVIKRLAPQHLGPGYVGNGCPGILRLINQYESDAQVIEAFQPLIQKHSKVGPMVQDELAKIQNMHGEDLDNQVANFLGYLYLGTCTVANLEADIEQCLEAGLQKAQAARMDAQERAAQEAAREREALAAQAAQQAAQEEAALEAQIAQVQAELEQAQAQEAAENARRADAERNRQAAIAAQAQAILAKANQDRANFEAQERAYQEQQKIRAETRQRSEEDTRVAAANEEAEQPVAQEDPIVQEPEAVAAPDLSQARPVAATQDQAPAVQEVGVADELAPAPVAQENPAVARLAALRAQQEAAHARAQEAERMRQEAAQAAQAPRLARPAVPVAQAAAAAQPNAQAGWFDGGLSGVFNNLWESIKANPKTSAAIGIGVAALLYNVISSFMGDDEDEEDDSIAQDEEVVDAPAPERAPVRQAKPAKTTTTLSPEEAEQSRLQGLKRKRAQMRREFFKNRGSRCKSRCKKRCR